MRKFTIILECKMCRKTWTVERSYTVLDTKNLERQPCPMRCPVPPWEEKPTLILKVTEENN